jgi:hypothetical protein
LLRLPKIQGYAQNFWEGTAAVEHAAGMFFGRLLLAYQKPGNYVLGLLSRPPQIQGYAQNLWEVLLAYQKPGNYVLGLCHAHHKFRAMPRIFGKYFWRTRSLRTTFPGVCHTCQKSEGCLGSTSGISRGRKTLTSYESYDNIGKDAVSGELSG